MIVLTTSTLLTIIVLIAAISFCIGLHLGLSKENEVPTQETKIVNLETFCKTVDFQKEGRVPFLTRDYLNSN